MDYYPLKLELSGMYRPYMWGGRKLASLVNAPTDEPVAELWAVSDRPEEEQVSRIANGPLAGQNLQSLIAADPIGFLGFDTPGHRFPILVKTLDAKQRLSVQVHPPKAAAIKLGGQPKAEAWIFLSGNEPNAYVYAGFKPGVTRETFAQALRDGSVESLLHRLTTRTGDVLNIPNGRLHGVGEGCFLLEVQQNSNTTYRVFDYNRVDPKTGQMRPLHIEEALASLDFHDVEPGFEDAPAIPDERGDRKQLLATEHFTIERFTGKGAVQESTAGLATIVANVKPETSMTVAANDVGVEQKTFEFSLIPAAVGKFVVSGDDLDYVLIRPVRPAH